MNNDRDGSDALEFEKNLKEYEFVRTNDWAVEISSRRKLFSMPVIATPLLFARGRQRSWW